MKTASILFRDGTALTAERNGDSFILNGKPDFPEDLSVVHVTDDEGERILRSVKVLDCASIDGRYWFVLAEKSKGELLRELIFENIAEIEDALCELDKAEE